MALRAAFGSAVERNDDKIAILYQCIDNASHHCEVGMLQRVAVVTEGTKSDFLSTTLNDAFLHTTLNAAEQDALLAQALLCALDARLSEVVGVVVGHAHVVEAHFLQARRKAGRRAEGIAVGTCALRRLPAVAERALEVAHGQVGTPEDALGIVEQVLALVLGQHTAWIGGAHHHIAHHGNG